MRSRLRPVNLKGVCHHCRKPGHYRPECPERAKAPPETALKVPAAARTVTSLSETMARGNGSDEVLSQSPTAVTQNERVMTSSETPVPPSRLETTMRGMGMTKHCREALLRRRRTKG